MQKQLHPGARWLFRIRGYFGAIFFLIFISFFIFPIFAMILTAGFKTSGNMFVGFVFLIILAYLVLVIIIAEIYARMAYNRWFYEFTDTNLKIEKGIIWKKYSNIPYERVQNVDIQRGIIARMLGFSSVNIQTAGYSYTHKGVPVSEGYIPGVDMNEAEQIRDFLMKKITKRSKSGL